MASHELLKMYSSLNTGYVGELPRIGPDVKCVQCDGCDRVITFAVFHSAFGGGVDVCNICRIAASRNADQTITGADRKSRISFAADPLCFVAAAPLPQGYEVDPDEVEVETRPAIVARRFAKSVDVVPCASSPPTAPLRRKGRGSGGAAAVRKRPRATAAPSSPPRAARLTGATTRAPPRAEAEAEAEAGRSTLSFSTEPTPTPTPMRTPPPTPTPKSNAHGKASANTNKKASANTNKKASANTNKKASANADKKANDNADKKANDNDNADGSDGASPLPSRQQRALDCAVAHLMRPLLPGTRPVAERPATVVRPPLAAFDHSAGCEFVIAPDGCCRMPRGLVALSPCVAIRAAQIVPTLPSAGLWVSVLCEEECHARLDVWACDGPSPARRYSVLVGRHTVSAMDWLPVPLHREDSDVLGLCTFVRGRYVISAMLPRAVPGAADVGSGACVSAEICGATLLRRDVDLADVRWSTSGASFAETFLFAIGRCTSVVVLQPTGDTRAGRLTLHVVHCIDAHGVPRAPLCLRAPPLAVAAPPLSSSPGGPRAAVAFAHGASAAVFQAPEFSARLFVALDGAACALHLRGRELLAGLEGGAVVRATTGEAVARLRGAPLLIAGAAGGEDSDGEGLFVADASGDCVCLSGQGAALDVTPVAALRRLQRSAGKRASLVMGRCLDEALFSNGGTATMPQFALHPLRQLLGGEGPGPILAYYPDGTWALLQSDAKDEERSK